jgi:Lon protease-like protein
VTVLIALFPLGHVLVPGGTLPLHIFEPRYRAMIDDLPAERGEFGVLSIRRGTETSDDVAFARVGTTAEIVDRQPNADGTSELLTIGHRRFEVRRLVPSGRPYLRAEVDWLPEEPGPAGEDLVRAAHAQYERYLAAAGTVSVRAPDVWLSSDPVRASYQLAQLVRLPRPDQQNLLAAPTAGHRLRAELALMRRELTLLQQTRTAPVEPRAWWITPAAN